MNPWDYARMYNSLARIVGWDLLQPAESAHESNKEYRPINRMILPFLF